MAFNIANSFWVLGGLLQILMVFTFPRDEQALKLMMDEKAKAMSH
jgi:hypothetical protein